MSEELVDLLLRDLTPGREFPCVTGTTPLEIPDRPNGWAGTVRAAVEREYALKLADVLFVSTYWGHERRLDSAWLHPIAREMGRLLNWTDEKVESEVAEVMRSLPPV